MFKNKEEGHTYGKNEEVVRSNGIVRFGLKALLYTTLTIGTIFALDHYNIPSRLMQKYHKAKESIIEKTIKSDDSVLYQSFSQYVDALPDSSASRMMANYLSTHELVFDEMLKNEKMDSLLMKKYNGVKRADNKLEYILDANLNMEQKKEITIGLYKNLDGKYKWQVAKEITKETFGL